MSRRPRKWRYTGKSDCAVCNKKRVVWNYGHLGEQGVNICDKCYKVFSGIEDEIPSIAELVEQTKVKIRIEQ